MAANVFWSRAGSQTDFHIEPQGEIMTTLLDLKSSVLRQVQRSQSLRSRREAPPTPGSPLPHCPDPLPRRYVIFCGILNRNRLPDAMWRQLGFSGSLVITERCERSGSRIVLLFPASSLHTETRSLLPACPHAHFLIEGLQMRPGGLGLGGRPGGRPGAALSSHWTGFCSSPPVAEAPSLEFLSQVIGWRDSVISIFESPHL
ncbi:hypothetical protein EYF80_010150 [Liparis tanakae]|uniref:Uncharacterized protein n=1 Tax=Liparis tanakae TaxID=230148 RepID=A0A4Z2IPH5_9TELE|nr:hypothetical protein EYF80_010150 [Liparis tanakae]